MGTRKIKMVWIIFATISILGSSCATSKERVLVLKCETSAPQEKNREGYKNAKKREKILDKVNEQREKERN